MATPEASVWLLWEWPFLRGVYASRDDAENVADGLRAKWVKRAPFTHAVNVLVKQHQVSPARTAKPDPSRAQGPRPRTTDRPTTLRSASTHRSEYRSVSGISSANAASVGPLAASDTVSHVHRGAPAFNLGD